MKTYECHGIYLRPTWILDAFVPSSAAILCTDIVSVLVRSILLSSSLHSEFCVYICMNCYQIQFGELVKNDIKSIIKMEYKKTHN